MNRLKSLTVLLLFVGFSYFSYTVKDRVHSDTSLAFDNGEEVNTFSLMNMTDEQVELNDVIKSNKYTWINFWATWCGPCREEMPMMAEIYKELADKGLAIVAVNVNERKQTITSYLDQYPVPFMVLRDSTGDITQSYNVEALPTSILVDSTGVVQRVSVGYDRSWEYQIPNYFEDE